MATDKIYETVSRIQYTMCIAYYVNYEMLTFLHYKGEKTRKQDVEELSFADKWKKMRESRRKRSDRSIYERFFIEEWMLHPNVLIGTKYTNMDFWWDGNSSNQLTLYQERSELVTKLLDQRWGHKRSEVVRNMMRESEKKRDDLRVKTEHRNPLGT